MLPCHRALWGLDELMRAKLLEQSRAQSKYHEMFAIMALFHPLCALGQRNCY